MVLQQGSAMSCRGVGKQRRQRESVLDGAKFSGRSHLSAVGASHIHRQVKIREATPPEQFPGGANSRDHRGARDRLIEGSSSGNWRLGRRSDRFGNAPEGQPRGSTNSDHEVGRSGANASGVQVRSNVWPAILRNSECAAHPLAQGKAATAENRRTLNL